MKKFNKEITVSVSVDAIAGELLEGMHPEFKHRELVAEAMIATSLDKGTIGHLYSALHGHLPDINFKVDDVVICKREANMYVREGSVDEPISWKRKYQVIGECKVIEVNPFADREILIEYNKRNDEGADVMEQMWVDKNDCKTIPPPEITTGPAA